MNKFQMTKVILKSIDKKNKICRKCIRRENCYQKEEPYGCVKTNRDTPNKIIKLSKGIATVPFWKKIRGN